jgi:hypothetical protein
MDLLILVEPLLGARPANLQSLHIPLLAMLGIVFRPHHLAHVRPRHVEAKVSQYRGVHRVLKGV